MRDEKKYTERDLVRAQRRAYLTGVKSMFQERAVPANASTNAAREFCISRASILYPLPTVTRPRVVKDGDHEWRCVDGVLEWRFIGRIAGTGAWHSMDGENETNRALITWPKPHRITLWADLLANPTETVPEEADESHA